jgi:hypothetical protein
MAPGLMAVEADGLAASFTFTILDRTLVPSDGVIEVSVSLLAVVVDCRSLRHQAEFWAQAHPGRADMYSSTAAIILSLIIAALVLIISLIILFNYASNIKSGRLGPSYAIGAGAASFAVAFSVLNLALSRIPLMLA